MANAITLDLKQPYQAQALGAITKATKRIKTKLEKIAQKDPGKNALRLRVNISWNAYHELTADIGPEGSDRRIINLSSPYGPILTFDAPEAERQRVKAFTDDKPIVAKYLLEQLANWWAEVPKPTGVLPVVGGFEGEEQEFDFAGHKWAIDPRAAERKVMADEFRGVVQARMALFRPFVYERLTKALKKIGPGPYHFQIMIFHDDDFEVMFGVHNNRKDNRGRVYPPYSSLTKILKRDPYPERRDEFEAKGIDTHAIYRQEQEQFLSRLWNELAPGTETISATLEYHDDGATFDLVQGRWVTDFLGRSLLAE